MVVHKVQCGECLATIARQYHFPWQTIYQAQENEAFRKKRPNPNVIYEGDEIVIPDKRLKEESAVTEKRHLYKLKSSVWMFRLEMRDETFKGLEGIPYELRIEGMDPIRKRTGKNGLIETRILAEASSGALLFQGEKFQLNFGGLDPVTRMSGVQQRLSNLGFKADPPGNGAAGSQTCKAIAAFQSTQKDLKPTGKIDSDTRKRLLEVHDNDKRVCDAEEPMTCTAGEAPAGDRGSPGPGGKSDLSYLDFGFEAIEDE